MHVYTASFRKQGGGQFRELKNAIKKSIFPSIRGSGGQIKFLIKKKTGEEYWYQQSGPGKILGQLAFYTWVCGWSKLDHNATLWLHLAS